MPLTYQPIGQQEILQVSGTPAQVGAAIGEATTDLIAENIARDREATRQTLSAAGARGFWRLLADHERYMAGEEPDLLEEIEAMAVASGQPYYELLFLNFSFLNRSYRLAQQCSCFLARAPATGDGKTYLAKTRDMKPNRHVVVHRHYPEGVQVLEVMAAGTPGFPPCGINDRGLAIATGGVWCDKMPLDMSRTGEAYVMPNVRRLLRQAGSVDEMVDLLREIPHLAGINITAADRRRGVTVEVTADGVHVTDDRDGVALLTNHYMTPALRNLSPERSDDPSSFYRYERLTQLLGEAHGRIGFKEMLRFLSDHQDGPANGVCRHAVEDERRSQVATIMVIEDGELWTTLINPCEAIKHIRIGETPDGSGRQSDSSRNPGGERR